MLKSKIRGLPLQNYVELRTLFKVKKAIFTKVFNSFSVYFRRILEEMKNLLSFAEIA